MKKLKLLIFILLSITILSCNEPEDKDGFWEPTSRPSKPVGRITVANNGDIWATPFSSDTPVSELPSLPIYLSTDNGDTWVQKFSFQVRGITSIAINSINGYIFFNASSVGGGIFRSTNRGEYWLRLIDVPGNDFLLTPSGELYLGTYRDIFYSSDNGDNWIEKSNGLPPNQTVVSLALGKDGTLYEGTSSGGVYRSSDGGDTWLPPSNHNFDVLLIRGLAVANDGSIFASAWTKGLLKSTDKGVTWTQINTGLAVDEDANLIVYNPITNEIFASDAFYHSGIYRSTDLGESWKLENSGIPNNRMISALAFNPNTGQMYVATDNGFYRSKNYP